MISQKQPRVLFFKKFDPGVEPPRANAFATRTRQGKNRRGKRICAVPALLWVGSLNPPLFALHYLQKGRERVPSPESARTFNARDDAALCELAHGRFASHPSASVVAGRVAVTSRSSFPDRMRVLSSLSMTTLLISLFLATPAGAAEISLQLRVLRFGLLQDGDVGVGVLPESQEVLIRCLGFSRAC